MGMAPEYQAFKIKVVGGHGGIISA